MMRHATLTVGLLVVVLLGRAGEPRKPIPPAVGSISGLVRFTGVVPAAKKIVTNDGSTILHNDLVVDVRTKGLRGVVAVLEDLPAQPKTQKAKPVVVDQRDMMFNPRVVAVQHGQAVRFENNDLCNHSVQAISTLEANQFNRFAGPNQPIEYTFEPQKTPVCIGCSLHGWMRAWVYVVPHAGFAVSDAQGKFQLDQVPPGKHVVWLRHADAGLHERRTVEVLAGKSVTCDVEWKKATPE